MISTESNRSTDQAKYKLYNLSVRDAEKARLLEIVNDPAFLAEPDDNEIDVNAWVVAGLLALVPALVCCGYIMIVLLGAVL